MGNIEIVEGFYIGGIDHAHQKSGHQIQEVVQEYISIFGLEIDVWYRLLDKFDTLFDQLLPACACSRRIRWVESCRNVN